jgi:hypothetical protein
MGTGLHGRGLRGRNWGRFEMKAAEFRDRPQNQRCKLGDRSEITGAEIRDRWDGESVQTGRLLFADIRRIQVVLVRLRLGDQIERKGS